jgi:hypothetical protein
VSNAASFETLLTNIINSKLPGNDYTIYKNWTEEGFRTNNGIQFEVNYSNNFPTTEQTNKITYTATIYIYRTYQDYQAKNTDELAQKEQLRSDFENLISSKDFQLVPNQNIFVYDDRQAKKKCKAINFNITFN